LVELAGKLRARARVALVEARIYLCVSIISGVGLIVYFTTYGGGIYNAVVAGGYIRDSTISILTGEGLRWDNIISQLAIRLGAVFIAVFVMQILVSFARYKFRLSDNLGKMADICEASDGDLEKMKVLSSVYLLEIGDVSQFLQSPADKMADLAKEAISRIPKA
jgi:hypothetical protein